MRGRLIVFCCLACCALSLGGCRRAVRPPALGDLYNQAAMKADVERNPVIVIPGILGSKLVDPQTGQSIWGVFSGDYADPRKPANMRLIALPMQRSAPLSALQSRVVSAGALDRVTLSLFGLPFQAGAYVNILATLGVGGYRDEQLGEPRAVDYGKGHFTCFQFDYDWRRSNVENAAALDRFIQAKQAYIRQRLKEDYNIDRPQVKFDIVAHSMGGLIAHYYLRYGAQALPADGSRPPLTWAGCRNVGSLLMVGTPNAGSINAFQQLLEGNRLVPIVPRYPAALLGTMPSVYELLPRARHGALVDAADSSRKLDLLDPALWERMGWGLADPRQEPIIKHLLPEVADPAQRRAIALDHQRKCLANARQFHEALDVKADPPPGVTISLTAGDAVPTLAVMAVDTPTGKTTRHRTAPGDGTVVRTSALMDERVGQPWVPGLRTPIPWRRVLFLFTDHIGMTRDPAFADNVLFTLLEQPADGAAAAPTAVTAARPKP